MPQQVAVAVENNFTKGLITESTGLNFPENASTDTDNCEYTLIGDVLRRQGIDFELGFATNTASRLGMAVNTYRWKNAGGDGLTEIVVSQIGNVLYFYHANLSTVANPLSTTILSSTVDISSFVATGVTFDPTIECQFSDGNGYLFVYHPNCDPLYCTYAAGTITGNSITIQIRDFTGVPETGVPVNSRPSSLTAEHSYNLSNQGWVSGSPWAAASNTLVGPSIGSIPFQVASGIAGIANGQAVLIYYTGPMFTPTAGIISPGLQMSGTVTGYSGTTLTINVDSFGYTPPCSGTGAGWYIIPRNIGYVNTWFTDIGNYPSNSDVWWYFRDSSNQFNPTATVNNVTLSAGNAPQGHFLLNAFRQFRSAVSGAAVTDIVTSARPKTGCWFQGRVWYTGVDAQQPATGDANYYTWTENIYFSQIIQTVSDFGSCYQTNDPTSEDLFALLPSDGGVIQIQGCGSIYKLFPMQNALLVFAANGVWYVTGSTGIGFTANDYTIVKLSSVQSISSTSFVDVNGLPYFWNEEGIYAVTPAKQGTSLLNSPLHVNPLEVNPITVGTILTFYNSIPRTSKQYVRGAYHPIDYVVQWVYKSTQETSVTDRYSYDKILNYNTVNNAFFPYTVDNSNASINGIIYISYPGAATAPDPSFKYLASGILGHLSFAEEYQDSYTDWQTSSPVNYTSYFITGYKLRGQAIKKFQPVYIQMYSRQSGAASAYKIQGIWDWANDPRSGRWSGLQVANNALTRFDTIYRRHKIRGHGYALQFKITSVDGMPFDIQGWAIEDTVNQGV